MELGTGRCRGIIIRVRTYERNMTSESSVPQRWEQSSKLCSMFIESLISFL